MLKSLSISNYALIESLEIEFPEGLIIITGETGAGKSILLGAISLLLGAKAEREILKDSSKNCIVEALFTIEHDGETLSIFKENEVEPTQELIIRRVVSPSGRTRSFINDEPVTNKFLKDISEKIVDIHAQHEHLLMGNSTFRLSVLDSFAGSKNLLEEYRKHFYNLGSLEERLAKIEERLAKEEADYEYNLFQYNAIKEANLYEKECEELENEQRVLANTEEIKNYLNQVNLLLNPNDASIIQTIKTIEGIYEKLASSLEVASNMAQRVESSRIELIEIERENAELADKISANPKRLEEVEERLALIYSLYKKHRVDTISQLQQLMKEYGTKLSETSSCREKIEELEKDISAERVLLEQSAAKLKEHRLKASQKFSNSIQTRIRELEMPFAIFMANVVDTKEYTQHGKESIEFLFSINKEIAAREISKIASGGELSRIMLCLKTILAKESKMPTLIFDEIDSGVSGSIADKMGNLIDELSQNMQLFVITHLPQIASKGSCHLLVYKEESVEGAISKIRTIKGDERVMEIARMLSGSELTKAAIANAREFLNN